MTPEPLPATDVMLIAFGVAVFAVAVLLLTWPRR
jgi:hypothetical protein